jgi:hypothetical protein
VAALGTVPLGRPLGRVRAALGGATEPEPAALAGRPAGPGSVGGPPIARCRPAALRARSAPVERSSAGAGRSAARSRSATWAVEGLPVEPRPICSGALEPVRAGTTGARRSARRPSVSSSAGPAPGGSARAPARATATRATWIAGPAGAVAIGAWPLSHESPRAGAANAGRRVCPPRRSRGQRARRAADPRRPSPGSPGR